MLVLHAILALAISAHTVVASDSSKPLHAKSASMAMLEGGRYEDLDRKLAEKQQAYSQGKSSDVELLEEFRVFYNIDPALEVRFNEWVAAYPKSYVARLGRGIYYKRVGMEHRGDQAFRYTSEDQLKTMAAYYEKAMRDFDASLALEPKPILSYLYMMDIEKYSRSLIESWLFRLGLVDFNRRTLKESIRVAPHNFVVRRKLMHTLESRWGGSVAAMAAFLAECKKADLSRDQINALEGLVLADQGWMNWQLKNYRAAVLDYKQALALVGTNGERLWEYQKREHVLQELAHLLQKTKDYGESVHYLNQVIEAGENSSNVYLNRGISLYNLGKKSEALEDYLRAAQRGDAWAQNQVGIHYWHGIIFKRDKEEAIKWFGRSAEQGFSEGVKHFEWAQKS